VETATSWPVAAVRDAAGQTVGCVLPQAPPKFRVPPRFPGGDADRFLEVDWLARPGAAFARRGLTQPAYAERLSVSHGLVSVAALFGRYGLVYSDWSYSNAFYSPADHTAFVIDVDGCGRHRMPNIFQPNWDDPHTSRAVPADAQTDRYRVALLVGRLLTGERSIAHLLYALDDLPDQAVAEVLRDCLLATDRMRRPGPTTLLSVLDGCPYLRMPIDRMPLGPRPAPAPTRPPNPIPAPAPVPPPPTRLIPPPAVEVNSWPARIWAAVSITFLLLFVAVLIYLTSSH
jgi:hypothetical protein